MRRGGRSHLGRSGLLVVLYGLTVLLLAASSIAADSASAEPPRFSVAAPGIAHALVDVRPANGEPFLSRVFRIDLDVADLRLVPAGAPGARRTVAQIVASYSAVAAVNASFFDQEGRAMGLVVDGGQTMAAGNRRSWGALVVDGTRARIVLGADIEDHRAHRLIVQGIPRLVVGGQVQKLKPQMAERTAVCAEGGLVVLVVATKAESTAFARFLATPVDQGGLGCPDALNLDGGPSTQLVARLPGLTLSVPGGWGVPNALVATPGQR